MICPKCDRKNSKVSKFCKDCGFKLVEKKVQKNELEVISTESNQEGTYYQIPNMWKWYFSFHPRSLLTIPVFIWFIYSGIFFIIAEVQDLVYFFQIHTWGAIGLSLLFGSFLLALMFLPIYFCFASIQWIYELNTNYINSFMKKLFGSIGLILLVTYGTSGIRYLILIMLGLT